MVEKNEHLLEEKKERLLKLSKTIKKINKNKIESDPLEN
jgi:hypothetical protein